MVELRVLGPLQVSASDGRDFAALLRQSKRTALLAYLATAMPRGMHRRDKLLALFWPESDDPHARAALSQALYVLRNALGEQAIEAGGDAEVGLRAPVVRCDAVAFEAALDAGRPAEALPLYRGDLLEGFFLTGAPEFERWVERERARLRQRASEGAWALAQGKAAQGDPVEAERWARRAADLGPADEAVVRRLMTFLHGLGDRAAAVRAYEAFAWDLTREYALKPSAETDALVTSIRQEEGHRPVTPAEPSALAPSTGGTGRDGGRPRRRGSFAAVLVAAALAGVLGYGLIVRRGGQAASPPRMPRVVVLPFQNLGAAEDAYFADGITDEITARLATVSDLRVVGGQSVLRYRGTVKTPRQIAKEMGADYVLEGTVSWQRSAGGTGRVRIRPQLIDGRDESQIWATVLDQDLTDVFTLVSGVTRRVVDELQVALQAPQESGLRARPTTSLEAYDYYLRGREFTRRTWTESNTRAAIEMLGRAVGRDSTFAVAYAWLSFTHTNAYWMYSMGVGHLAEAERAAERALQLDPHLSDAHMALGHYYYACCGDYGRAMSHLAMSLASRPGDSRVMMFVGNVYKRQGRWDDAVRYYERAASLDPGWVAPLRNLAQLHLWLRRYDDAEWTSSRVLSLEPRDAYAYEIRASVPLLRDADTARARRVLLEAAKVSDEYEGMKLPFDLELWSGNYRAALARVGGKLGALDTQDEWLVSDNNRKAVAFRLLGDSAAARGYFDSARVELEAQVPRRFPRSRAGQNWLRSALAISYAGVGRREAALEQTRLVVASDPTAVDAISGPVALQNVALAYVMLGEKDAALDVLERLLSIPARISLPVLRLDPLWDPLRGEPRFERLVSTRR